MKAATRDYLGSRTAALREALRRTLGRPLRFLLVTGSSGIVLSTAGLLGLALWRVLPFEAPQWTYPQALVLIAGAEGEIDLSATRSALRQVGLVGSVDFLGRDTALAELAQRKGLSAIGLNELRPNPLPDAFIVRFAAGAAPDAIESAVAQLRKVKNVDSVEYHPDAYRKLFLLAQVARRLLLLLAAFLSATLAVAVALAASFWVRVDRDELRVLRLLGADPPAIRRPYVYAGAVHLAAAAGLAWGLLAWTAAWLEQLGADLAQQYSLHWASNPLLPWMGVLSCVVAALLGGALASAAVRVAMRRSDC